MSKRNITKVWTAQDVLNEIQFTEITAKTGQFVRYTAQEQRSLFGFAVFGKKRVAWNGKRFEVYHTTMSQDYIIESVTLGEVADAINERRVIQIQL